MSTPSTNPANETPHHDLSRFHEAQEGHGEGSSFATAVEEIRNGHKTSHWMWYVFPQLPLGSSRMSKKYAIADADEARAYLSDEVLRERLLLISREVCNHLELGVHPTGLMGSTIDCEKLSSSMTLFGHATVASRYPDVEGSCIGVTELLERSGLHPCAMTTFLLGGPDKRTAEPIK